ncbi:MAG: FeoB small GTPase domain-containing protein [Candidatus Thorarchaeota archaeon]|jgi:ferrous iron transport protein B
MKIRIALIGNPNVGKSVVFNNLTGMKQHTGNWPGKTVEVKEGYFDFKGYEFEVIDLPGVYSLSALSDDEEVAREYLIDHRPDVVVDILNAAQLERNLYLTLLLIEMQLNLVVVLNMYDVVKSRGDQIDIDALSQRLGVPIVVTTATKKIGMDELLETILYATPEGLLDSQEIEHAHSAPHSVGDPNSDDHLHYHPRHHHHGEYERLRPPSVKYSPDIEIKLKEIVGILEKEKGLLDRFPPRWLALRILERDDEILLMIQNPAVRKRVLEVSI